MHLKTVLSTMADREMSGVQNCDGVSFSDVNYMDCFRKSFDELYDKISKEDREGMREMMRLSTYRRKRFDKK